MLHQIPTVDVQNIRQILFQDTKQHGSFKAIHISGAEIVNGTVVNIMLLQRIFDCTAAIPGDIYEAGMIDGAGKWQTFKSLTLPMLMPFVSTNLILSTKNMLMVFDQIMALTKGGPAQSTESISYLIYKNGMDGGQFGFQSANAVVFFVVIVTISIFQMAVTNKKEEQL